MAFYKNKPVIIEAVQWDGKNIYEVCRFLNQQAADVLINNELYIKTLEGVMHASVDDFIIKGINGEYYPCKPDIFNNSYDKEVRR